LGFKENDESLESVKQITEEIIRIKQLMKWKIKNWFLKKLMVS
jgi:hypothetical protein